VGGLNPNLSSQIIPNVEAVSQVVAFLVEGDPRSAVAGDAGSLASSSKSGSHRRINKLIQTEDRPRMLQLGDGIMLEKVTSMAGQTLVGRVSGHHLHIRSIRAWAISSRGSFSNPPLMVLCLTKGCFMMQFSEVAQAEKFLNSCWSIDSTPSRIKKMGSILRPL